MQMRQAARLRGVVAGLAVAAALAAGCSGGGKDDTASKGTTTTAGDYWIVVDR